VVAAAADLERNMYYAVGISRGDQLEIALLGVIEMSTAFGNIK
jgi:hypothetical protein